MRGQEDLIHKLRSLKFTLEEVKSKQPLAGDGWIVYRNVTGQTLDIDTALAVGNVRRWLITFTPDHSLGRSVADPNYGGPSTGIFEYGIVQKPGTTHEWYFVARTDFAGGTNSTIKVRFIVFSTQKGSLTVTAL